MTFLENLEPLVLAAEKYAELTQTVMFDENQQNAQREAELALLRAAIEFSKWGKHHK